MNAIKKLFAALMLMSIAKVACAQFTQIIGTPAQNDFCSFSSIYLEVYPYDPTHTYNWMFQNNSQFSIYGPVYPEYNNFATGQGVYVNAGEFGPCTIIVAEELDSFGNSLGFSSMYPVGSPWGDVPIFYDGCDELIVPSAYAAYLPFSLTRTSVWYKDSVPLLNNTPVIYDPDSGTYYYRLTLGCGSTIYSNPITINPIPKPVITAAGDTTVCQGDTVVLTMTPGYSYPHWYRDNVSIPGATGITYKATVSGNYTVTGNAWTGGGYCAKQSLPITVNVQSGAFITSTDTARCGGDSILLTCTPANSYVWKKNGITIPGATTQSIYAKASGNYKVITTGLICNQSKVKHIGIYAYPTITISPAGPIDICKGTGLTLTANGNNISAYKWLKDTVALTGGNTSSIYVTKAGNYKCEVANLIGCSKTSININVSTPVSNTLPTRTDTLKPASEGIDSWVTSDFFGQNTNYGSNPFFELSNWYKYFRTCDRGLLKFDLSKIPKASPVLSSTLRLYIDSVISWTKPSQTIILKKLTQPWNENTVTFNIQPASTAYQGITVPQTAVAAHAYFNVSVTDIVNYWVNDTSTNYGIELFSNEASYNLGWLRIATSDHPTPSQRPRLIVKYAFAKIDTSGATTFCTGDSVTLSTATGSYIYQWYMNNVAIAGAVTNTLTVKNTGNYHVMITNATGCTVASATKHITVVAKPAATVTALGPTTFCNGDSVKLQANTGAALSYQWIKGSTNIANATADFYYAKTAGTYKVKVTNASACTKLSPGITVAVPCREGESNDHLSFDVIPNPFNDAFIIISNNNTAIETLKVFDVNGKLVDEQHNLKPGTRIVNELQKGVYIIAITSANLTQHKRIVKY